MKVVFVLAAFCLVLVSANLLVKEPDKITCTTDFSCDTDKFDVRNLALSFYPDPPERGKNVTVTLTGIVKKIITSGEVQVVLKFNVFTIFKETYDACELALKYGHTCPIVPGPMIVSETFEVPSELPGGTYKSTMDGTDQDDNSMICGTVRCHV
ncbi:putative phosphatidylglycerol/phosphatidylinositol transfer protein DDB_G0282107 [Dysidea avara]|uniref:putative phosphatidylglycerol/phosphatidylinositol transfer protein DDB_G0282107 n=1 Tax=Dysidea avara TaxID=196820 RepID=UPI003319C719